MKLVIEEHSNLVEHSLFNGFEEIVEDSTKANKSIVNDATEFFDKLEKGRTLLILGEPGSGKTITLLRLAQQLIERTEENISKPIPVVFNLSSWVRLNKFMPIKYNHIIYKRPSLFSCI